MTSLVTRKRSRWKSETMPRKEEEEEHWERYVAKLWKSCTHTFLSEYLTKNYTSSDHHQKMLKSKKKIFK